MINLQVPLDNLKKDYPKFYDFFKNTLKNSQSRFRNYDDDRFKCFYYLGFFMKPSQKTDEYYERLSKMSWDERLKEEYKKVRITITMTAGKFALADQTKELCDTLTPTLDEIVARKIYFEQTSMEFPNNDIINSIPNINELKDKFDKEIKEQNNILEILNEIGDRDFDNMNKKNKNLKPEELLNKLIEEEKYEEAEELIKNNPELKKREE